MKSVLLKEMKIEKNDVSLGNTVTSQTLIGKVISVWYGISIWII